MKYLFLLSLSFLALSVQAQETIINDPNVSLRTVGNFHAIEVSSGIDLYLSNGTAAVAVSARDDQARDAIKTEVRNGVLYISYDWKANRGLRMSGGPALKAYVAVEGLEHLSASGGSDVHISGQLRSDSLSLSLSGGSDLRGGIEAGRLSVDQSGGSDVNLKGHATRLHIEASGGSDFNGFDMVSDECFISASGGSDINITVNKELSAEASGASDISWKGAASVRKAHASGAGSVSHRS
jgi:hypothetical protein